AYLRRVLLRETRRSAYATPYDRISKGAHKLRCIVIADQCRVNVYESSTVKGFARLGRECDNKQQISLWPSRSRRPRNDHANSDIVELLSPVRNRFQSCGQHPKRTRRRFSDWNCFWRFGSSDSSVDLSRGQPTFVANHVEGVAGDRS